MKTTEPKPRRARGTGTIKERRDGIWCAAISLGVVDGRRVRHWMYASTEALAEKKLDNALRLLASADGLPSTLPLGAFLRDWIATKRDLSPHTAASYAHVIGEMPDWLITTTLGRLNGGHVQKWVDSLTGSPRTVQAKRNVLRAALNDARRRSLISTNPAALVRVPRQRRPARISLSAHDCQQILAATKGWRYHAAVAVSIGCGLRQGELLGLAWSDLTDHWLAVRGTLIRHDGRYVLAPTKNESSARKVPVPSFASDALDAWDELQASDGRGPERVGLIFTTAKGEPVNGSMLTHQFQKRLTDAGLASIPWHALRHATVDIMSDQNVPQTVARDYVGHASVLTTQDHYTGSSPAAMRRAAEAIDKAIGGTSVVVKPKSRGKPAAF